MAYNPPIGSIYHLYTTYILPSGGLYATYHLLGEPETTIDYWGFLPTSQMSAFLNNRGAPQKLEMNCSLLWGEDGLLNSRFFRLEPTVALGYAIAVWKSIISNKKNRSTKNCLSLAMLPTPSNEQSLPGKQVAVKFHNLYPWNQPARCLKLWYFPMFSRYCVISWVVPPPSNSGNEGL